MTKEAKALAIKVLDLKSANGRTLNIGAFVISSNPDTLKPLKNSWEAFILGAEAKAMLDMADTPNNWREFVNPIRKALGEPEL